MPDRPIGQRTRYQKTHYPVRVQEVLCTSRKPLDDQGFCPDCGRYLLRGGRDHKPDRRGGLGRVEHYADGSTRLVTPEEG
jgi:hypothetical protein